MTNISLINDIQSKYLPDNIPEIRTGMEVEVLQKIQEGEKTRTQKFKGLVIKVTGKTPLEKNITVRRDEKGFGVEKIFPICGPTIEDIKVIREFKIRRSFIGYIRKLTGKSSRLSEKQK